MRIVAALCWYREPPAFLDRCVRSVAGLVDRVVALDGAWALFPDAGPRSTDLEHDTLTASAAGAGVDITVRVPDDVFASQVEKRAELMALASEYGDWILVIDGDEHVTRGLPLALRWDLERTERDAGDVRLVNVHHGRELRGGLTRRLYRAGTTVTVVHSGYTYDGRQLLPGEPTVDVSDIVTITHDFRNRGAERDEQALRYLEARQAAREEVWV